MENTSPQRMTIIILGAVLLAAVAVGAVIYFTPTLYRTPGQPTQTKEEFQGFDTAILSKPEYTALDASMFTRGLLPVQPPTTTGKQNPFQ